MAEPAGATATDEWQHLAARLRPVFERHGVLREGKTIHESEQEPVSN